jgi:hypothetical protein
VPESVAAVLYKLVTVSMELTDVRREGFEYMGDAEYQEVGRRLEEARSELTEVGLEIGRQKPFEPYVHAERSCQTRLVGQLKEAVGDWEEAKD